MKRCKEYEVELSALIDGESDPATAIELLDHMIQCASCSEFYRELRSFQSLVDDMSPESVPQSVAAPARRERRPRWLGAAPRWAWGVAAVLIVAVGAIGLWVAGPFEPSSDSGPGPTEEGMVIQLGEDSGDMDEQRFVELAAELLRADSRYQQEMYQILGQVGQTAERGESSALEARTEGEGGESTGEFFALVGGLPVLD